MAGRFRQFIVYSKVTAICFAGVSAVVVVFMNRNYKTKFWPGATEKEVPTLWLMLGTAVAAIVAFWLLSRIRRIFKEVAQVTQEKKQAEAKAEQARRAEELARQERRIDEKLKHALDDDNSQGGASD